jgi:hypothetical protein
MSAWVEKEKGIGGMTRRAHMREMTKARAIALLWCELLNQASFEGRPAVEEYWTLEDMFNAGFSPEEVAFALQSTLGCEPPVELMDVSQTLGEASARLAQAGFEALWDIEERA